MIAITTSATLLLHRIEAEEDMDFEEIIAINEREQTAQQNRSSTASNSGNNNSKPKVFRSFLKVLLLLWQIN